MRIFVHCFLIIFLAISTLSVSGCSYYSKEKEDDKEDKKTAEILYDEGLGELKEENYQNAIDNFEAIERKFPFSKLAIKSQVMRAFALYKWEKYESAVGAVDRFVKLHPGNQDVPYAYYLKAISYYDQITDISRDQGVTILSKNALKEVMIRFPDSEYAADSQIKLDLVLDHLAGKELEIGRFYLNQGNMVAAINRFKNVIDDYQKTTQVPEALHRLVEAYVTLGIKAEAEKYASVLGHNYPGTKWYQKSFGLLTKGVPKAELADEGNKWSFRGLPIPLFDKN